MKKSFKLYLAAWAVLVVVFNVICFAAPKTVGNFNKFGGAFWAGYIFIMLAFVGQLACAYMAFKADGLQKLFYNVSLIRVSYVGLIVMLVAGALCMAIPNVPNWVGIIVCLLVLAFTALAVIKAKASVDAVSAVDEKVKMKTFFIKSLTVDADTLMAKAKSDEAKAACRKVYEAVRYSDPMSSEALAGAESQITLKFNSLTQAVEAGDDESVRTMADELLVLIADRNKKCKLLK